MHLGQASVVGQKAPQGTGRLRMDIWTYKPARAMQGLVEADQVEATTKSQGISARPAVQVRADLHKDWEESSSLSRVRGETREGRPVGSGVGKHRQLQIREPGSDPFLCIQGADPVPDHLEPLFCCARKLPVHHSKVLGVHLVDGDGEEAAAGSPPDRVLVGGWLRCCVLRLHPASLRAQVQERVGRAVAVVEAARGVVTRGETKAERGGEPLQVPEHLVSSSKPPLASEGLAFPKIPEGLRSPRFPSKVALG
eukprot:15470126-Alexandrium_andersonii.AAC.1